MYELKEYQSKALAEALDFDLNALLAVATGLGKTIITLEAFRRVKSAWPGLIICPANVKWQWQKQTMAHLGVHATVLEGEKPKQLSKSARRLYIVNYDVLPYWEDQLAKVPLGCIVTDECQNLANEGRQRTDAFTRLAMDTPHFLALSATPLQNRPRELYPVLSVLNPGKWGSFYQYARRYCDPKLTPWGWTYNGASHLDELHRKLTKRCMIRVTKDAETLPPKQRILKHVELSKPDEYEEALSSFVTWLAKQSAVKARRASKALEMSKMTHLRMLVGRLKARAVVNWIDNWLATHPDEKLVVVGWHRQMLKVLHKRCEADSIVIDGSTPNKLRRQFVDRMKYDRNLRLLIGNINSLGVGVDGLQHMSRTIAFAELPWRPADVIQAEDRLYRIGQTRRTRVYYLVAKGTIEAKMCRMLQVKQGVISNVLDGGKRDDDLQIHDQLVRELLTTA